MEDSVGFPFLEKREKGAPLFCFCVNKNLRVIVATADSSRAPGQTINCYFSTFQCVDGMACQQLGINRSWLGFDATVAPSGESRIIGIEWLRKKWLSNLNVFAVRNVK